jgi:hypothetical protein
MQDVNSPIARLKVYRLFWIAFRGGFAEHGPERHTEPVEHSPENVEHFANRGGHGRSLSNAQQWSKPAAIRQFVSVAR